MRTTEEIARIRAQMAGKNVADLQAGLAATERYLPGGGGKLASGNTAGAVLLMRQIITEESARRQTGV